MESPRIQSEESMEERRDDEWRWRPHQEEREWERNRDEGGMGDMVDVSTIVPWVFRVIREFTVTILSISQLSLHGTLQIKCGRE